MGYNSGIDPAYSLGGTFVNSTDAQTGRWNRIVIAKNNTSFSAITAQNYTGNALTAVPLKATGEMYGIFTSVPLTSGTVVAYRI